mmetsp:Transcript_27042/g.77906  ORF Transcript_27042/g.77906 Transcript_27042/m.77906 type:complete len:212 (+) Transcript_27042:962-1597(+)
MVTSHGLSDPGNVSSLSQLSLALWACSAEAKEMKAHWRPGSQVVFRKRSVMSPNLENSARRSESVMPSGKEPTKIFFGALLPSAGPPGAVLATALLVCRDASCDPTSGSCPYMPWCRARVTSHGLMPPGNIRTPLVSLAATTACSEVVKFTKAHRRPGSQLVLMKMSSTVPYFENSACSVASSVPSGSEPTNTFLAALPVAVAAAALPDAG